MDCINMISCVQFIPHYILKVRSISTSFKTWRFSSETDTLCVEMNTAPAELIDTVENLRELWGTLGRTQTTLTGGQKSPAEHHIHASVPHSSPTSHHRPTHRTGKVTMILILSLSKLHSEITVSQEHFQWCVWAPFKLPHANSMSLLSSGSSWKAEVCTAECTNTADAPWAVPMV